MCKNLIRKYIQYLVSERRFLLQYLIVILKDEMNNMNILPNFLLQY